MPVAGLQAPAVWHWSAAVHTRGLAPTQAPASQVSVCVQALPSSHGAPLGLAGLLQTPDAGLQAPAVGHTSGAQPPTGFAPPHAPASQGSVCVQALPSSHGAPLGLAGLFFFNDAASPEISALPLPDALPISGLAPTQAPASQVSVCVQALPSSQATPLGLAGLLQMPDAGSQAPAVWHWSATGHTTGVTPTQMPPPQASACVQAPPSSHGAPVSLGGALQTAG